MPLMPIVAMNANASITPPNCASTDMKAVKARRSRLPETAVASA